MKVAPVIDLVVCNEMDQIVAALASCSLDFHQGQGHCLGAHCQYSFLNMRFLASEAGDSSQNMLWLLAFIGCEHYLAPSYDRSHA